jgi:hypothetical protein
VVETLSQLRTELHDLQRSALAESTQRAYASYYRSYKSFCEKIGYPLVPCDPEQACLYITFLARTHRYSSILKYFGIIRVVHLECGLPDPKLSVNYTVKRTLLAVKRVKGSEPVRKEALSPELLMQMSDHLDMSILDDVSFWAICLVAFFGLLRISNVIPRSLRDFDKGKHLCRSKINSHEGGLALAVLWAKNNQFRERVLNVALPLIPGHIMCPVTTVYMSIIMSEDWGDEAPAFVRGSLGKYQPIIYGWFMRKLKSILQSCGRDPSRFGSHSLRRGGASWALRCGMSGELVRILGDWRSDAYRAYLDVPLQNKLVLVQRLADEVVTHVTDPKVLN